MHHSRLIAVVVSAALTMASCASSNEPTTAAPSSSTSDADTTLSQPPSTCALESGRHERSLAGNLRTFRAAFPNEDGPHPVVIGFHGFGYTAEDFAEQTDLEAQGTGRGFAVVLPDGLGTPPRWHLPGSPIEPFEGGVQDVDDIAFGEAIVQYLVTTGCADPDAVYFTGFSNGGELAIQAACSRRDLVRALGLVASVNIRPPCADTPIAVAAVNNTGDPILPYNGGPLLGGSVEAQPALAVVDGWATINGCESAVVTEALNERVTLHHYRQCTSPTVLYEVNWDGHVWPGAPDDPTYGPAPDEISATDTLLEFFDEIGSAER